MKGHATKIPEAVGLLKALSEFEGEALIMFWCYFSFIALNFLSHSFCLDAKRIKKSRLRKPWRRSLLIR